MKRDAYGKLLEWKRSGWRKPLLLRGARQTGKTYLLKEFGREEYRKAHCLDFERDPRLADFFERDLKPERIIADLSIYLREDIRAGEDLLIFDEIQASNRALTSLKYFNESASGFHIAAAGSLLGVTLSNPGSFPVGKVDFLDLFPMSFLEFLDGVGESMYREYLERIDDFVPLPEAFHEELSDLLRRYCFVGGMPEAVREYSDNRDLERVREIQLGILDSYALDFAKHAPIADIPKLALIWESLPVQLARENKRFLFSAVKKGARAREYEDALGWLEGAGLIHRAFCTNTAKSPLKAYSNRQLFKIYVLDVGLLAAMARLPAELVIRGDRLFTEFWGSFTESLVAQYLRMAFGKEMYYWRSPKGTAEVDFLCEIGMEIIPLEVKSGLNPRSKSLRSFIQRFKSKYPIRTTPLNLRKDGRIGNIPLYALPLLEKLVFVQLHAAEKDADFS
ncbi:MAG: ATP-binding protein [Deltaproteobacteria bacterium]|nr:ATP-binding protein [Deltaproteobacteria bacterium]